MSDVTQTLERNKQVVNRIPFDGFVGGDLNLWDELASPNFVDMTAAPGTPNDRAPRITWSGSPMEGPPFMVTTTPATSSSPPTDRSSSIEGEASRGAAAADISRTLLLLTPEFAADVAPIPEGGVRARVVQFAGAYTKLCLQQTATTAAEVEAWRLPVVAARVSEGIPEQTSLLQVEVARLTS